MHFSQVKTTLIIMGEATLSTKTLVIALMHPPYGSEVLPDCVYEILRHLQTFGVLTKVVLDNKTPGRFTERGADTIFRRLEYEFARRKKARKVRVELRQ